MLAKITTREVYQAQIALVAAIGLQAVVWKINHNAFGSQYIIVITELVLAVFIGFTAGRQSFRESGVHHLAAIALLALISAANISSLVVVLDSLIISHAQVTGLQLLSSALAIFATNIIVFALWYWEIDSPGLTRKRWSKHDKDFQFTQQDKSAEFSDWRPEFFDYLYLSITNAINFAPADTRPLSRQAKMLMAAQALVSVFTLALVIARSVSILN